MDELKNGDSVTFIDELKTGPPLVGKVEALKTKVLITWPNGNQSTEAVEALKLVRPAQPDPYRGYPSKQLMAYGAEKAELQRVLTRRNATIGRLRAANRELRRELRARDRFGSPGLSSSVVYSQAPPSHAEYDRKVVQIDPSETEPTPLPTVPPRVGGVYRTRKGDLATCESRDPNRGDGWRNRMRQESDGSLFTVCDSGTWSAPDTLHHFDLVAEISPPPEPAFTWPLEVGGWYEDDQERRCHCISAQWYAAINAVQFFCVRDGGSDYFYSNGTNISSAGRIIRKVDPPGGES